MENSVTQKTFQIHIENKSFECHEKLRNTENTTDPQRICELWVPEKAPKHRKYYRSTAKMLIVSAMERSETQKALQIRSENVNYECHGKLRNTENITNPHRKKELWVPGEAPKHRKHYRSAAHMRTLSGRESSEAPNTNQYLQRKCKMLSAMERSETQKALQIRSDNANCVCHGKLRNTENITDPQRKCNCECYGTLRNTEHITDQQQKGELCVRNTDPHMESCETQKTSQIRNEYANFGWQRKLRNTENLTDSHRKCKFLILCNADRSASPRLCKW